MRTYFALREGRGTVGSHAGLLAVELPAGRQRVTLAYRCWAFVGGVALAMLAALATGLLWLREWRN